MGYNLKTQAGNERSFLQAFHRCVDISHPMNILVVEDSKALRETLHDGLAKMGYGVDSVGDGAVGLDYAKSKEYDVLVVRTSGGDRLVPFVSEVVPVVDLEAGHVRVADIGGLLSDEDA